MRRNTLTFVLLTVVLGMLAIGQARSGKSAEQSEQPAAHPIVGPWLVHDNSGAWHTTEVLITFHGDGSVIATTADGITAHGAWQATGERTAELNMLGFGLGGPPESLARFLSTVEVVDDGNTWIRSSAIIGGDQVRAERISPEGASGCLEAGKETASGCDD